MRLRPALLAAAAAFASGGLIEGGLVSSPAQARQASATEATAPTWRQSSRFLMQASFGPTPQDIRRVRQLGYAGWIEEQSRKPIRPWTPRIESLDDPKRYVLSDLFWENAIEGHDPLRARVAYALANIVTVSASGDLFWDYPEMFAHYHDALQRGALGNYGDMIREVSLSPAMGVYLSHLGNRKANPENGTAPDENYAREVMQLFTIGLDELNIDGTSKGRETYTTKDVEGLAAVFTGLAYESDWFGWPSPGYEASFTKSMVGFAEHHEPGAKQFLGTTVPGGTDAVASVEAALDHLLAHENLAPFVSRQLIQHLVTSNPAPGYVRRVAYAFSTGRYVKDGVTFGDGRRGDMTATVAAILLDHDARDLNIARRPEFGRVRDPILRFAHLTRAFRDRAGATFSGQPPDVGALRWSDQPKVLGQRALHPPSVFGWYRPGYVAPGSWTGTNGKVAPEMQLSTASNMTGYISWMNQTVENNVWNTDFFDMDYRLLERHKNDPRRLVNILNNRLVGGMMSRATRDRIEAAVTLVPEDSVSSWSGVPHRVSLALLMTVTSADYAVQR